MKLKIGDRVVFSEQITSRRHPSRELCAMMQRRFMVISKTSNDVNNYPYTLEEDLCDSVWSDDSFEYYIEPVILPEELFIL